MSGELLDPEGPFDPAPPAIEGEWQAIQGENLGGGNLAGANLGGANLGGANLGGANLGGANLGGANLGGANLGGTNLGGNNLGGNNMSATNLGGANLAGLNLGGANLGGKNLSASNLSGSNLGGANTAGNNISGSNLGGANLAGANTGKNIHNLSGTVNGMLYSGEDIWLSKSSQCVVFGIGSTAFPKLLGQQSANAKISVALGMLPWGFAKTAGGSITLRAWEAVVWGDRTYCVFVMATPLDATWPGVAGFIKAVFRWNAPPTQMVEISGIEASLASDPTVSTGIVSYTGMMNAGARWRSGSVAETAFIAGELAFASATTNNQTVLVDFSSWMKGKTGSPLVLGNVQSVGPPRYAEAMYIALDNGDGTVSIILDDAASRASNMPSGMIDSVVDLNAAYLAWKNGIGSKPVPRRCGGALFLNTWFGEPVPPGKCDDGLTWAPGFCMKGASPWSSVSGTTAPMNGYMQLTQAGGTYERGQVVDNACTTLKPVLSETYVHMWERNYDLAGPCAPESDANFCSRLGRTCGTVTDADNCGNPRTVSSCGSCLSPEVCGGDGTPNVCAIPSTSYEGEAAANTFSGGALAYPCAEAFSKFGQGASAEAAAGTCSGGHKVRYLGNTSSNHVTVNNVYAPAAGTYAMTVYAYTVDPRTFYISVNGGSGQDPRHPEPGLVRPERHPHHGDAEGGQQQHPVLQQRDLGAGPGPHPGGGRRRRQRQHTAARPAPSFRHRLQLQRDQEQLRRRQLVGHHHLQEHRVVERVELQGRVRRAVRAATAPTTPSRSGPSCPRSRAAAPRPTPPRTTACSPGPARRWRRARPGRSTTRPTGRTSAPPAT